MSMEIKFTPRGFAEVEFLDDYGAKCSIQKSSSALVDRIWFGVNDANPKIMASDARGIGMPIGSDVNGWVDFPIPEEVVLTTRMHLNRDKVAALIPILERFVATGELYEK